MKAKLEYSESYQNATPAERAAVCNGVGPASWPEWVREILDGPWLCFGVSLRPAAKPHDWDYEFGETEEDKIIGDKRFGRNMVTLVKTYIPWWHFLRRRAALAVTKNLYLFVRYGGDCAFWAGKEKPVDIE